MRWQKWQTRTREGFAHPAKQAGQKTSQEGLYVLKRKNL
jgi:hypothetical protein